MNWNWVLDRLKEPSTWSGLAGILGSAAVFGISSSGWGSILAAGMAVAGAVSVVKKEKGW